MVGGGVLEEGRKIETVEGTPQGAVISPLLANVYLHYVYDLWVRQWRQRQSTGDMIVVRYADDTIVGFERQDDAERFLKTSHCAWPISNLASIPKRRGSSSSAGRQLRPAAPRSRQAGDVRLPWVHALFARPDEAAAASCWEGRQLASGCGRSQTNQETAQGDPRRRRRGARQMACPGASWLVGLLRRADERAGNHSVPAPSGRSLAPRHRATGTGASARMAANEGNRQSLPAVSAHPASVARTTVSRQSPEVGSTARRDLCGGRPAMAVPTATPRSPASMCHNVVVGERHN